MPYYNTLEEDLKRAKEILDEGRPTERDLAGLPPLMRESLSKSGGTIFGKDVYAAYKLLESFVAEIERNDDKGRLFSAYCSACKPFGPIMHCAHCGKPLATSVPAREVLQRLVDDAQATDTYDE